jgi:SAM-dependent methyltransferase
MTEGPAPRDGVRLVGEATRRAVEAALRRLAADRLPCHAGGEVLLLDVGGRGRPYAALASSALAPAGYRTRHIVADPGADSEIICLAERLAVRDGAAGLVLCTQVLEHVPDPSAAVKEMARVLLPGGACLLTTHGTWFYHPDPEDYWRWTGAGLRRLFTEAGFTGVDVRPVGGTKLALATLVATSLQRAPGGGASRLARTLMAKPVAWMAERLWLDPGDDRRSVPGELALNYVVTARR